MLEELVAIRNMEIEPTSHLFISTEDGVDEVKQWLLSEGFEPLDVLQFSKWNGGAMLNASIDDFIAMIGGNEGRRLAAILRHKRRADTAATIDLYHEANDKTRRKDSTTMEDVLDAVHAKKKGGVLAPAAGTFAGMYYPTISPVYPFIFSNDTHTHVLYFLLVFSDYSEFRNRVSYHCSPLIFIPSHILYNTHVHSPHFPLVFSTPSLEAGFLVDKKIILDREFFTEFLMDSDATLFQLFFSNSVEMFGPKFVLRLAILFRCAILAGLAFFFSTCFINFAFTQRFVALNLNAGNCDYVSKAVTLPQIYADYYGYWQGNPNYNPINAQYQFSIFNMVVSPSSYAEYLKGVNASLVQMGDDAKKRNLAENLLWWSR